MFILVSDSGQKLSQEQIKDLNKYALVAKEKNSQYVGILIRHKNSPYHKKWLQLSLLYKFQIIPFIEIKTYSETSLVKETYIFVLSNQFHESLINYTYQHIKKQSLPFLTKESLHFFERLNYPLLKLEDNILQSAYSEKYCKFPIVDSTENLSFESTCVFDNWVEELLVKNTKKVESASAENYPFFFQELVRVIQNTYKINPEEIASELDNIQKENLSILFLLALELKKESVTFNGAFLKYHLSHKVGLISVDELDLTSSIDEFIFRSSLIHKQFVIHAAQKYLSQYNFSFSHPITLKEPIFSELFKHFLIQNKEKAKAIPDSTLLYWTKLKEDFDNFKGSKSDFFDELKFLLLLEPKEYLSFQKSLSVIEEDGKFEEIDRTTSALFCPEDFKTRGDTLLKTKEDLKKLSIPYIQWT